MAKGKKGLEYFSFDIDFFEDEKIEFASAKYGLLGELIAIKLLCRIYRNGYFIEWNDDICLLFAKKFGDGVTYELLDNVIQELIKREFFNKSKFDRYGILTSKGIQSRYLEATKRRKHNDVVKEFLVLKSQDVSNLNDNVNIVPLNDDILPQSKVKESKVKESKEKESKEKESIYSGEFDLFWDHFPKKKSKGDAYKAWKKLSPDHKLRMEIIGAIQMQRDSKAWMQDGGQYIPHPATWLRARGWEDELETEVSQLPYSDTTAKNIKMFNEWNPEG